MKYVYIIIFLALSINLHSTIQVPDKLEFNNIEYDIDTGWGHPSILERYYLDKHISNPFRRLQTNLYRGHIATWEVQNNRLYLKKLDLVDEILQPKDYSKYDLNNYINDNNLYFANWFTGLIHCYDKSGRIIFEVEQGVINSYANYDFNEFNNFDFLSLSEKSVKKIILNKKYNNYIEYFFRSHSKEYITFKNKTFEIVNNRLENPILNYKHFNHNIWPYNWNNLFDAGAPVCKWKISENKIILEKIMLYSGTNFYNIDIGNPNYRYLQKKGFDLNKGMIADWVNGIYLLIDYSEKENYKQVIEEIYIVEILNGKIKEEHKLPNDSLKKGYNGPGKKLLDAYN